MAVELHVEPSSGWAEAQEKFKAHADGKAMRLAMNKRIIAAAKPLQKALHDAVRAVPSQGGSGGGSSQRLGHSRTPAAARKRGGGLRETIARSVKIKVRPTGVTVYIDSTTMPDGQRKLPKYLDGQGRWRHPVYPRANNPEPPWVQQKGTPWWTPTIEAQISAVRSEVEQIVKDVLEEFE